MLLFSAAPLGVFIASLPASWAVSIAEIQGVSFQSPYAGQLVHDVTGIVTAKDRYGLWISGEPSPDPRVSTGLRIYGSSSLRSVMVGDLISLSGRVTEYRPKYAPNDLFLTELDLLRDIVIHSHDNVVEPLVLGRDRIPPTGQLSAADKGPDGWLSVPNNVTLLESLNATLQPDVYALDFWESLEGRLVTIPNPVAAGFPNRFGSAWVYGDWPMVGKNSRGGLTLTSSANGAPDAHGGAVLIGHPLDGTRNPRTAMGVTLSDITGIVTYQYGNYHVLPFTAFNITSVPKEEVSPVTFTSSHPCEVTIGDYNVENMGPRSHHLHTVAEHIVHYLNTPDIVFVQEIQDDSGTKDDGVVSANKTLSTLTRAIAIASKGKVYYDFANVEPVNNMDGGQPGGNIRVAYLWRPDKVSLVPGSPIGNATQATQVQVDRSGKLALSLNPGRIDPTHPAWIEARKPIAAAWQTSSGDRFFTVNVHYNSKRDSSSTHGDARPPVNGRNAHRATQVNVTATFVKSVLDYDANASVVVGGDMNEYIQTRSVFVSFEGLLTDINEVAGVPPQERYTYVFDQNTQEIDHIFVSDAIAARGTSVEHVHINTWAESTGAQASDHDPSVAKVWVCAQEMHEQPEDLYDNDYLTNEQTVL
ncbi:endonuclease/exonuclease/phosphatase [Wolfiporia cocos MD-104 SS10]|uniref:Endonuclease/exonuclease/phosphatase n=1 Tax=Wolfiporia cocos (strain MD-104) TaxID=742152 RepID=A0A2H3JJC5_WOLCO|nr:endonuclease/exonuclease/phosphatase [Wolfiporia cocos MD-104 SS10]